MSQAASYASDSASKYMIKGVANNNYKLSGSMTQTNAQVYKGAEKNLNSLSLHGNLQKKYSQCGNRDLGCGCNDEFGLKSELIDEAATEVTTDPSKRVQKEVDNAIRRAISKTISQAVSYALDEAFQNLIDV